MTIKRTLSSVILAAGLAVTPVIGTTAMAQDQIDGVAVASEDGKIDAFIIAALAVSEVRDAYIAQLQAAESEEQQMQIVEEADAAILQAVEDTPDITVDEYIAIGEAATTDPDLAAEIDARFAEQNPG